MKTRWKILLGFCVVAAVVALAAIARHYQLKMAVAHYRAELKAKGEPMDLAQVIPPPVPLEQNGVLFIKNALTNLPLSGIVWTNPPKAMQMILPGKAETGRQQPNIIGFDATNSWEDLGRELAAVKADLDSFQRLTNYPVLDFNLDYQKGFDLPLPHLAALKRSAQWLSASALYNLHQGNVKNACVNVRAMLAIVKGQSEERLDISQLVRMTATHIAVAVTWEILQDPGVSENDLAALQRDWQSLEFIRPVERAYLMERIIGVRSMEQFRRNPNDLWRMVSSGDGAQRTWHKNQWRWFWSYADEKRALETQGMLIKATRMVETNGSFQFVQSFVHANFVRLRLEAPQSKDGETFSIDIDEFGTRWLFSEGAYSSFAVLRKSMATEAAQNVTLTAVVLKRYALRHHQLPTILDDLTPDLLPTVPLDPMDGKPLRYKLNSDGTFLLYSIGENGVDDGGNPALEKGVESSSFNWQNPHALDWVWPQPATGAEIQKYYDERGKKSD